MSIFGKLGIAAAIIIAVGTIAFLMVPVLCFEAATFPDRVGGNYWRNLIYDFQTLITGGLAVFAASVTVAIMAFTESRQEGRHRHAMKLNSRPDALRVERMLAPHFERLRLEYKELRDLAIKEPGPDFTQIAYFEQLYVDRQHIAEVVLAPFTTITLDTWSGASDLFDGLLFYHWETARAQLLAAQEIVRKLQFYDSPIKGGNIALGIEMGGLNLPSTVRSAIRAFELMFPKLYELADLYEIKI